VVECLLCKSKAESSNPSPTKTKQKQTKQTQFIFVNLITQTWNKTKFAIDGTERDF
jgi:hypothetical protein